MVSQPHGASDDGLHEATDATVIERSLGEPDVFAVLFDRHFDAVHAYAQRRVGLDLADEIAAETFTRAFDRRGRYDGGQLDARPWLLGIAANLLRRHWRSERRRLLAYGRAGADGAAARLPGPVAGDVAAAVAELPKDERDALLLVAWADLSYEDVAVALGVPIGTVRSRLARARRRVRDRLEARAEPRRSSEPIAAKEASDA